ncbi:hypothetical protein DFJ67_7328 [Asanoa ferruginea]|uniref:Tetratricopeptide repeat protein n=1 Tax=Asanoa ferruginea TaxID=53367 RepID=A0A3D9ZVP8_9ACTN|nr:hypothetical protein [Asanoa ferruginea]REG01248.1 hypothetical protein DFJ67_7328 [Asanoa ferruginea]GIF53067.1 hypothetical protein Afe04nite_76060 [Asanoa ferruginea]
MNVTEMLDQAREMPYGAAQIALLEQAIAHADAQRLADEAFEARMLATTGYIYGGEPARSFVTFSWCLTEFDQDPVRYGGWTHHVLWSFKAMVNAMTKFPEIPLARTEDVLDDMERRWKAGGHSPHAVYMERHLVARHVGDVDAAEQWFERWSTAPRDDLSDCIGCDPTGKAYWLARRGRDDEAIALAEPVLAGRLSCTEQPHSIHTALLLPYLRTGRTDAARDAHRRAYRAHRTRLADLGDIAEHIRFCALTGNDALGLEIVERHLDWLDRSPTPWATMTFAASAALVLRRLDAAGHRGLTVGDRPVGAVAEDLATRALDLAARFDARNGTGEQTAQTRETLATTPIGAAVRLAAPGSRSSWDTHTDSGAAEEGQDRPVWTEAAHPVPETSGPDELLDLAEARYRDRREAEAFAAWNAFDDRYADGPLTDLQRARRLDGLGSRVAHDDDHAAAEQAWQQAAALYAAAGDEVRRQIARGRLGMGLLRQGRADEGGPLIEESTAYLLEHGAPGQLARAHLRLAYAQATTGRLAESVATSRAAQEHAAAAEDPSVLGQILSLRAQALGRLGEIEEAAAAAGESRQQQRAGGQPDELAHACLLHGAALRQLGEADAALAAFDEALSVPCGAELRRLVGRQRAGLLANSARAAEAITPLAEEIAALTAAGDRETVPHTQHELAIAYLNAGRALDAAEVAEEALAAFEAAGDDQALGVRDLLVAVYQELAEHESMLTQLTALATAIAAQGDPAALGRVTERLAEALDKLDRDATAAARFAEAAASYTSAGRPIDAVRTSRRHATSLLWAGQPDQALAALAAADTAAAALPGEPHAVWERAMLDYDGARLLDRSGRAEEAIPRAARAMAGFRELGAGAQAGFAGLLHGELLRAAGRHEAAETALSDALALVPDDEEALRGQLEGALSAVRDDRF